MHMQMKCRLNSLDQRSAGDKILLVHEEDRPPLVAGGEAAKDDAGVVHCGELRKEGVGRLAHLGPSHPQRTFLRPHNLLTNHPSIPRTGYTHTHNPRCFLNTTTVPHEADEPVRATEGMRLPEGRKLIITLCIFGS